MSKDLDLVGKLDEEEKKDLGFRMKCFSPDDGKYGKVSKDLKCFLSAEAEWLTFVNVQRTLMQVRVKYSQATKENYEEFIEALSKIDTNNMQLLENKVTKHDQLAVIEELGRHVSPETKALLHPGTTSYDIVDTARSKNFIDAWYHIIRGEVEQTVEQLCEISEKCEEENLIMVGRTHLQHTSPIPLGQYFAGYAARIADRISNADVAFSDLCGKISGIVGTGAGIEAVIGEGKGIEFEKEVLYLLGLKPDYTATQVIQKEKLADVGNSLVTLMHVLGDFAGDMRYLYSSDVGEVTSRAEAKRLGGSSTDAGKNNPINWENIEGKGAVVESGMRILYEMIKTDMQRDLRSSVQGRYQPQQMMVEVYESFKRANKALKQLSINENKLKENLSYVRENPSEAMVTILKGEGFIHSKYGAVHDFVKEKMKESKQGEFSLFKTCYQDPEFKTALEKMDSKKRDMLMGNIELYIGNANERARINREYARKVING